ncbi:MAG: Na(+)/H(+) antiporter subunit B [Candidatus Poribacteria bacterium]|nr:Na(+)/H(+) antiporter subunit B [Candidatus Poribacteria bacterium]
MKDQVILRAVVKLMIPPILIFGLYVVTHGELGPGGGFQGGVILAAAFIVYGLVFGVDEMRKILPRKVTDFFAAFGVLLYAGTGVYCLIAGYKFLDYFPISGDPGRAESWGMILVEWGVTFTVGAVMVTVYNEITEGTGPGDQPDGEG